MKEIYNEGRILGFSSYELYVRQQLSENPDVTLPTEREWLTSSIGAGSAMLLKIPARTVSGYHDYPLPVNSALCGCSHIFASVFVGDGIFDENGWATKVTDYGELIPNNYETYPSTPGQPINVPCNIPMDLPDNEFELSEQFKSICTEYTKIVDGICYQPGTWNEYHQDGVEKEFVPDPSQTCIIRLRFSAKTTADTFVLFSGFLFREVVAGTTGFDACMDTESPQNGDFLGPMSYPWAVKITFNLSNDVNAVINGQVYSRALPIDTEPELVDSKPVIDYNEANPNAFYEDNFEDSLIPVDVTDLNINSSAGASVLTAYQDASKNYPPVLYGAKVTEEGEQTLAPLDVAAPGVSKIFEDQTLAQSYSNDIKNVYGMHLNDEDHVLLYRADGTKIDMSSKVEVEVEDTTVRAVVTSGDDVIKTISLTDSVNGELFNTDGDGERPIDSEQLLNWTRLLQALSTNRSLDIVGPKLKKYRDNIEMITDPEGNDINTGSINDYIEFSTALDSETGISSGKRLYISSTEPTGSTADPIPDGSLGIGW